jgi:hypothetical protein
MVLTTVLAPALSSRRGRNVRRILGMSGDGIDRMIFRQPKISLWHVLSLGRGNR